jgi:hypothetical protein
MTAKEDDPIEAQLKERMKDSKELLDLDSVFALSEFVNDLANECAALRRLCGEATYCIFTDEGDRGSELSARLRAAANGESVE